MGTNVTERVLSLGEFRRLSLEEAKRQLQQAKEDEESRAAGGFVRRIPPPLLSVRSAQELFDEIVASATEAIAKYPQIRAKAEETRSLSDALLKASSAADLLDVYRRLLTLYGLSGERDRFSLRALDGGMAIAAEEIGDDSDGAPAAVVLSDRADQAFVASAVNVIAAARRDGRSLTQDEHSAVLSAYRLLDKGVQLPSAYRGIGVYGFRDHQTCLSVANPGEGHVRVTCASADLLRGTVIHIEHIDRDGERDREKLEPYRLPAALNAARVRLHTGAAAPCTAYVGRPVFESGNVGRDMLKSVHMTASACSAMFINGVADCKIGIERMTASECVRFMRAVAGNAVRDATRQYLSAAFNINLPVMDDRGKVPVRVEERFAIARLGIDLAVAGRFEKVTWDGSSNQEPSVPIIEQLPYERLIELVHLAHERGLETYVSAGLQPPHMRICTYIGVDGVGIGTSLHDYNPETGLRGQLKAERVREVLAVRDAASGEALGRGATLLARMDRMYFEGTLPVSLEEKRHRLFDLMIAKDEGGVLRLVEEIGNPGDLHPGADHPVMEQAKRVLETENVETVGRRRDPEWAALVGSVKSLVRSRDLAGLYEVLP